MTPVTALVTVFIFSGLTAIIAQTRMAQLFDGYSYFASDTLHNRNETKALCAKWNMSDLVNLPQVGLLLFLCHENAPILPSFRARYWLIKNDATATEASTINFVLPACTWTENVPVQSLMLRVLCLISPLLEYNGTVPSAEEPPPGSVTQIPEWVTSPYGGDTTPLPPPAGSQTELPNSGSILFQIPMKTQFLYMILVLVIPLFIAYSQTFDV